MIRFVKDKQLWGVAMLMQAKRCHRKLECLVIRLKIYKTNHPVHSWKKVDSRVPNRKM